MKTLYWILCLFIIVIALYNCSPIENGIVLSIEMVDNVLGGEVIYKIYKSSYNYDCSNYENIYNFSTEAYERIWVNKSCTEPEHFIIHIKYYDEITASFFEINGYIYGEIHCGDNYNQYWKPNRYKVNIEKWNKEETKRIKGFIYVKRQCIFNIKVGDYIYKKELGDCSW